jgi:hypothetical protein
MPMAGNEYKSSGVRILQVKSKQYNPLHAIQEVIIVGGRSLTNGSVVEVVER